MSGVLRDRRGKPRLDTGFVDIAMILILALAALRPTPISGQTLDGPKSPKEVVQAYRKMDAEGERLTNSGWYRASTFFIKPGQRPQPYVMVVIESETVFYPTPFLEGSKRAEVWAQGWARGQIDSRGRFSSTLVPALIDRSGRPSGEPQAQQVNGPALVANVYDLVLTDTHWEFGPGHDGLRQVKGPPQWRIETFEMEPRVTIETAIRYLTRLRDGSSSEAIQSNAERSIGVPSPSSQAMIAPSATTHDSVGTTWYPKRTGN